MDRQTVFMDWKMQQKFSPIWSTDLMQFNQNPSWLFINTDKLISNLYGKANELELLNNFEKEGSTMPHFKTYNNAAIIKAVSYWSRYRHTDQLYRITISKQKHKYDQLIFGKGVKAIQWRKDHLFKKWY